MRLIISSVLVLLLTACTNTLANKPPTVEEVVTSWADAAIRGDYETASRYMQDMPEMSRVAWQHIHHGGVVDRGMQSYSIARMEDTGLNTNVVVRFSGGTSTDMCAWLTIAGGKIAPEGGYDLCDPQPTPDIDWNALHPDIERQADPFAVLKP